jgi:hypothetical protein
VATAHWQATHAADPAVRRLMAGIAEDETRHAALGWEVHRWAAPQLSQGARERIQAACRRAIAELEAEDPSADALRWLGLPTQAESRALVAALRRTVWRV